MMTRGEKLKVKRIWLLLSDLEREDRERIFENIGRVLNHCENLLFPGEHLDSMEVAEKIREI